jgi:hypothetical protein
MTRILAIADEVDDSLYCERVIRLDPDLVVACGDLPFDYLEYIVTMTNVPLLYVPGNHDPDLRRPLPEGDPASFVKPFSFQNWGGEPPGPAGCINIDGRIADAAGLRLAGLGGSLRYKPGPNQYTQPQMGRRALRLEIRGRLRCRRDGRQVDVLVTHAAPFGVGDGDDPPHHGFKAFHRLVAKLSPRLLVHGHVHPYGRIVARHTMGSAEVVNVVGHRLLEA